MTVFNRGAVAFAVAAGSIVLANCGGGGGSSGGSGAVPTSNPTATPTQAAISSTLTAPLPPAGVAQQLPSFQGAGGTITYPTYVASKSVVEVTYTTSVGLGLGAPAAHTLQPGTTNVETEQISANAAVTFSAYPSFALYLPTAYADVGPLALEVFDQTTGKLLFAESAASVEGRTINFKYGKGSYAFVTGHVYAFELVTGFVPSPAPTPTPRPTPTPTASPVPTPTPTQSPTPTPSPTSTPACNAPPPDPHKSNVLLTGDAQTLPVPCFDTFRANVTLPKNNGGNSSPIDVELESSTDKPLGAPPASPKTGTPLFYESFKPSDRLVLHGTVLTADISSDKRISASHTYAANFFLGDALLVPTVTGLVPIGNNLTISITLPDDTAFPAGRPLHIVLYESS